MQMRKTTHLAAVAAALMLAVVHGVPLSHMHASISHVHGHKSADPEDPEALPSLPPPPHIHHEVNIFHAMDSSNDHQIEASELDLLNSHLGSLLPKYDKDGSGSLSEKELYDLLDKIAEGVEKVEGAPAATEGALLEASQSVPQATVGQPPNGVTAKQDHIVFVHGYTADSVGTYSYLADELNALGYTTHMIDIRGSGLNRATAGLHTLDEYAQDIVDYISAQIGTKKAVVIGHSFGGVVALRVAEIDMTVVSGLILLDPTGPTDLKPALLLAMAAGCQLTKNTAGKTIQNDVIDAQIPNIVGKALWGMFRDYVPGGVAKGQPLLMWPQTNNGAGLRGGYVDLEANFKAMTLKTLCQWGSSPSTRNLLPRVQALLDAACGVNGVKCRAITSSAFWGATTCPLKNTETRFKDRNAKCGYKTVCSDHFVATSLSDGFQYDQKKKKWEQTGDPTIGDLCRAKTTDLVKAFLAENFNA